MNKKLGLLLLPLIPLSAIGIVEVANAILPAQDVAIRETPAPRALETQKGPRFSKPHVAPVDPGPSAPVAA